MHPVTLRDKCAKGQAFASILNPSCRIRPATIVIPVLAAHAFSPYSCEEVAAEGRNEAGKLLVLVEANVLLLTQYSFAQSRALPGGQPFAASHKREGAVQWTPPRLPP